MALMREAFEAVGGTPVPGSALDQGSLIDGDEVVEDYLRHGEPGVALEHLVYMIWEADLPISDATCGRHSIGPARLSCERDRRALVVADANASTMTLGSPRGPTS